MKHKNRPFISTPFIYLDVWSIAHFIGAYLLMTLLLLMIPKFAWATFILLLTGWELVERLIFSRRIKNYQKETSIDTLWDIFVGLLAGIIATLVRG